MSRALDHAGYRLVLTDAGLFFYAMSLIILLMDAVYMLRVEIVVTAGRASVGGPSAYTFTGFLLLDQAVYWILCLLAVLLLLGIHGGGVVRALGLALSLTGLTLAIALGNTYLSLLLAIVCSLVILLQVFTQGFLGRLIHSALLAVSLVELVKIAYMLTKLLLGVYPWFTTPLYVNIVVWYVLWPLIPLTLLLLVAYGALSTATRVAPRLRLLLRRLPGIVVDGSSYSYAEMDHGDSRLYLLAGLAASMLLAVAPYAPTLNPKCIPVNTDWIYYYRWLNSMIGGDFTVLSVHSDRLLYLLLLYTVWAATRIDPRAISVYHNLVTLPLYTLSLYLLAKRTLGDRAAGYVAVVTPISPLFLSFIYGGFQANLLALSLVFTSIYLLLGSRRQVLSGLALFTLVMVVHELTWIQYMIVFTAYVVLRTAIGLRSGGRLDWKGRILAYYLVAGYIAYLLKNILLGPSESILVAEGAASLTTMASYLESTRFYTTIFTGGSLDNPLFYIVALYGVSTLGPDIPGLSIIIPLTAVVAPWTTLTYRLILNTPLTLLAGYGLARMSQQHRVLVATSLTGIALWRLFSIIPGLPLTP